MGFRAHEFAAARLEMPTAEVPIPDLAQWFDGPPVWRVRALSGNELAKVEQAERRTEAAAALAAALESGAAAAITSGVRDVLGYSGAIEDVYARQIEILVCGSVEPAADHALAARLGECYPVPFKQIVNTILMLTGQGASAPKKPPASTETPA